MVATYGKYVDSNPTKNAGRDELANEKTIFNYFTMKTFNLPKLKLAQDVEKIGIM